MNKPTLDELLKQVKSKYALVVLAAKRARTLSPEQLTTPEGRLLKAVSVALQEIADGEIRYEVSRGGMK